MKISEYIAKLEKVMAEIGDVEVQNDGPFGRHTAAPPSAGYALILKGRASRPMFWTPYKGDEQKGEAVCRV